MLPLHLLNSTYIFKDGCLLPTLWSLELILQVSSLVEYVNLRMEVGSLKRDFPIKITTQVLEQFSEGKLLKEFCWMRHRVGKQLENI